MEQRDETASLISAGKVQGTNVFNIQGESLGEIYDVMIDNTLSRALNGRNRRTRTARIARARPILSTDMCTALLWQLAAANDIRERYLVHYRISAH